MCSRRGRGVPHPPHLGSEQTSLEAAARRSDAARSHTVSGGIVCRVQLPQRQNHPQRLLLTQLDRNSRRSPLRHAGMNKSGQVRFLFYFILLWYLF